MMLREPYQAQWNHPLDWQHQGEDGWWYAECSRREGVLENADLD